MQSRRPKARARTRFGGLANRLGIHGLEGPRRAHNRMTSNARREFFFVTKASPAKEEMLLEILEKFHGYLMKYVTMIIRGTMPPLQSAAAKDSKLMLRTLIPRNTPVNKDSLNAACKMLHLAFKGMTTEDIYDTLAYCFMRAARRYDRYFTDKMKSICEAIQALPPSFK